MIEILSPTRLTRARETGAVVADILQTLRQRAAVGTNLMSAMGGLRRGMPATFWSMTIGLGALIGLPPLAGFWSKDEILHAASGGSGWPATLVYVAGLVTVFLTAGYAVRLWLPPKGRADACPFGVSAVGCVRSRGHLARLAHVSEPRGRNLMGGADRRSPKARPRPFRPPPDARAPGRPYRRAACSPLSPKSLARWR